MADSSIFMPEKLYGVIGQPLAQTLSPLIHNMGFQTLGLPGVYLKWEIGPGALDAFVASCRILPIAGVSVTIPHKSAIMPLLDSLSETAALAGAVNTLFWKDSMLCGDNTDVTGFIAPLADIALKGRRVLLLGAGGAAHAAAAGLHMQECAMVWVCTPGNTRHLPLATRFSFNAISWDERYGVKADLIINATPMGMKGAHVHECPYDFGRCPAKTPGLAYDMVYNPLDTRFLREARVCGWQTVSGEKMFMGQADAQFMRWTGQHLPHQACQALLTALGACCPGAPEVKSGE